jgi:hypothetical protein
MIHWNSWAFLPAQDFVTEPRAHTEDIALGLDDEVNKVTPEAVSYEPPVKSFEVRWSFALIVDFQAEDYPPKLGIEV